MTDVALVATAAAAAAAVVGLVAQQWQKRRESIDQKVAKEVAAKFGDRFSTFVELQDGIRMQIEESKRLGTAIKGQLDTADEASKKLVELLDRANESIPAIARIKAHAPALLLLKIREASDIEELIGLLYQLLDHADASSFQLETGGDTARQKLDDEELAQLFYTRALELDQGNLFARAAIASRKAGRGTADAADARAELIELAQRNPRHRYVLSEVLNFFIEEDDYQGCIKFIESMLDRSPYKSLLWRNLAICRREVGESPETVTAAFENAVTLAGGTAGSASPGSSGSSDFVNAARPYVGMLIELRKWDQARRMIVKALTADPLEAQLYILKGDLERAEGNFSAALSSYTRAYTLGNPREQRRVAGSIASVKALEELQSTGALNG